MKKHGVAEFGQACVTARHVPRNTCCRHKGLHDYKRVSSRPAYTAEHKSTWNYSYTNTLTPNSDTLPAACTKLQTTFNIGLRTQKRWFQKRLKSAEIQGRHVWTSMCWDKGGGYQYPTPIQYIMTYSTYTGACLGPCGRQASYRVCQ